MASKRYDLPHLAFFQGFEAAARTLSFTKAAEELFITQSAVSRQIKALEDHLGLKLFERRRARCSSRRAGRRSTGSRPTCSIGCRPPWSADAPTSSLVSDWGLQDLAAAPHAI